MDDTLLLVDKPVGISSFDVIRRLRKKLGIRKMGHAGTLDPRASGLMLIGVGTGTKRLAGLIKLDKDYDAEIILGEQRTTGDLAGEIVAEQEVTEVSETVVRDVLGSMVGVCELSVPAFSAIKQQGVRLYARARRGEVVDTPVRPMRVDATTLERIEQRGNRVHVFVSFSVGSGTYIRSLAEELGRQLGYPATLGNLRRTRVGEFRVEDALVLDS